jgi:hypothetical protein
MEDDLIFWQMEDDLNILVNGRQAKFCWQIEDVFNYLLMEDSLIFLIEEIQKQYQPHEKQS